MHGQNEPTRIGRRFELVLGTQKKCKKRRSKHKKSVGDIVREIYKETRIIDPATGEVKHSKVRAINAAFDEEKGYLFWARKNFAKSFSDVPYPNEMTDTEIGRMARLAKKIWSNTNMLGYRGNGGVRPYGVPEVAKELGISERQARTFLNKMVRLGLMARVEVEVGEATETHLYINPIYFFSSNRVPLNLYLIFREQFDAVLPEWVKREYLAK